MIIIGEKINGSIPRAAKAILEKDEAFIKDLAKRQADAGADFIDVCASVPEAEELNVLKWLISLAESVTETPLSIDSPSARVLADAVPLCARPGLVNSVSMEGNKTDVIFPLIAKTEWQCVALLSDDKGIPRTTERRLEVFDALMEKAARYGIAPSRIHVDPLVEMLCASEDGIEKVVKTMREIKKRCPDIHLTGGASNISFNLPARKFINRAFIVLSINAGMDSAILDPLNPELLAMIYAAEALLGKDEFCMEYIKAFRAGKFE